MDSYYEYEDEDYFESNTTNNNFNKTLLDSATKSDLPSLPKLLFMGLKRSGKSSIQQVVFHRLSPNETIFLQSTTQIVKENIISTINYQVWDFPGQIDFFEDETFDIESIFNKVEAIIYVIDSQEDYTNAIIKLVETIIHVSKVLKRTIRFEVLIHKVDSLTEETKLETQREIQQYVQDELEYSVANKNVEIKYYTTSIYDYSIHEALSKVVQRIIGTCVNSLEALLDGYCQKSGIEKAYIFDLSTKLYLATNSSPADISAFEMCCESIDAIVDIYCIYTNNTPSKENNNSILGSKIELESDVIVRFTEINTYLGISCLIQKSDKLNSSYLEYNFALLKDAVPQIINTRFDSQLI